MRIAHLTETIMLVEGSVGSYHSASCNICMPLRPCIVTHGHHSPNTPYAHWHNSRTTSTWQTPTDLPPRRWMWQVESDVNAADQWHYRGCETPPTRSVLGGVVFRGDRDRIWDATRREAKSNRLHTSYISTSNQYLFFTSIRRSTGEGTMKNKKKMFINIILRPWVWLLSGPLANNRLWWLMVVVEISKTTKVSSCLL